MLEQQEFKPLGKGERMPRGTKQQLRCKNIDR